MTEVVRASGLVGRPVVSIADGEDVAEVRDVVYDSERHQLLGFTLNKRGFFSGRLRELLSVEAISAIGPDAVMTLDCNALSTRDEAPPELASPATNRSVLGIRVLTADGQQLGVVRDVILLTGNRPAAVGYEVSGDTDGAKTSVFVPIDAQSALSGDSLVLRAGIEPYLRHDLVGFASSLDQTAQDDRADWPAPTADRSHPTPKGSE